MVDYIRITALLQPFLTTAPGANRTLSNAQLKQISDYLDLLRRWNQKIALTSVREPEYIVTRHFGESFFAAAHLLRPDAALAAVDVGSGAGFPGLPLKIYAPALALTLIESNRKKAAFLKEAARVIGKPDVVVCAERAEDSDLKADLVTLRAVERFESALQSAGRLVAPQGRVALLIGAPQVPTAQELLAGWAWDTPALIPQSSQRVLLVGTRPAVAPEIGKC